MSRVLLIVIIAAVAATTAPGSLEAAGYTFENIADSSGRFGTQFGLPWINVNGTIAFYAVVDTGSAGIFLVHEGAITRIARENSGLSLDRRASINARGTVAFSAKRIPSGGVLLTGKGGRLSIVVDSNGPMFAAIRGGPVINDARQIAFEAILDHGEPGIFIREPTGAITTVALGSGPMFKGFKPPLINGQGTVAFRGTRATRKTKTGIFTGHAGQITPIVLSDGGEFAQFISLALNDAGLIAFTTFDERFLGNGNGPNGGIYFAADGQITRIASSGVGEPFGHFGSALSMNDSGAIVFDAIVGINSGIFTGPDPEADKVIKKGDALFDSAVTRVGIGAGALNDSGQIAFVYSLADGRAGIAVATPVP